MQKLTSRRHSVIVQAVLLLLLITGAATQAAHAQKTPPKGWVTNAAKAPFPAQPASGVISGKASTPVVVEIKKSGGMETSGDNGKTVKMDTYHLSLRTSKSIFPDAEAEVFLLVPRGATLDNKRFVCYPGVKGKMSRKYKPEEIVPGLGVGTYIPLIQNAELETKDGGSVSSNFSENVISLRLEFGSRTGDTLPGKIYLCATDGEGGKHVVAGSFMATVK